jgi:protein TonB
MSGVAGGVAAGERLGWAIFVATAAHALLILGLGFGPPQPPGPEDVPTLEVTLLDTPVPDQPAPEHAQYLAQASQEGVGNVEEQVRPEFFDTPPAPVPEERTAMERGLEVEFVATRDSALQADIAPLPEDADMQPAEVLPEGGVTRVTASGEREHFVSVNARESVFAEYLAGWKARMERLGTLNYPTTAGQRGGNPVLEVVVGADGGLREVRVTRGSGNGALDQAAMDLVRLASPYDPFPATVRAQFDVLRFAYEWRFIEGRASSRLSAPER